MQNSQSLQQPITLGQLAEEIQDSCQTCEVCGKYFRKLSHFTRHMRERHSESRDYTCKEEDCGKSFKRASHLKRHMISHSEVKGYKCLQCGLGFGYKYHLDRHTRVIHLSEWIQCSECGLPFKKKKAYNKHVEKAHPNQANRSSQKGVNVEDSKLVDYTITKIGYEESMKNDDIYNSDSQVDNCAESQKLHHIMKQDFRRHLSQPHCGFE